MNSIISRLGIFGELLIFMWKKKLRWLIPLVVILVVLSILLILGSTGVAPFLYPFF